MDGDEWSQEPLPLMTGPIASVSPSSWHVPSEPPSELNSSRDDVSSLATCSAVGRTITVNTQRKQMGEHLKGKLESMIRTQFEDYLLILQTLQNDTGKLAALECELRVWRGSGAVCSRINISCDEDGTFLVYTAPDGATSDAVPQLRCPSAASSSRWQESRLVPPQEGEPSPDVVSSHEDGDGIRCWVESVCEFGVSGGCNSLTALLHFGYDEWKRLLSDAFPVDVSSELGKHLSEDSHGAIQDSGKISSIKAKVVTAQRSPAQYSSLAEMLQAAKLKASCDNHEQTCDICSEGIVIAREGLLRGGAASSKDMVPCEDFTSMLPQFLLLRTSALLRLRHYRPALQDADELISCEPTCAEGYYWQAVVLRGMGCNQEAMESLMQALAYSPENGLYQQVFTSLFEEMSVFSTAQALEGRARARHLGDAQSATTQATHLSSRSTTPSEVSVPPSRSSSIDSL